MPWSRKKTENSYSLNDIQDFAFAELNAISDI